MTTIQILNKLIELEEKKEKLVAQIAAVGAQIDEVRLKVGWGQSTTTTRSTANQAPAKGRSVKQAKAAKTAAKRGKRGQVGEDILAALKSAGKPLGIKELAAASKKSEGGVRVWLGTAGKKIKGLKKVSRGVYSFVA